MPHSKSARLNRERKPSNFISYFMKKDWLLRNVGQTRIDVVDDDDAITAITNPFTHSAHEFSLYFGKEKEKQ